MVSGLRTVMCVLAAILVGSYFVSAEPWSATGFQPPIPSEKASRTPAQRKIDSQLLYEIDRVRGPAAENTVPPRRTGVKLDGKKRALVDIRADATPGLQRKVASLKGTIVSISHEYRSIIAWIPLLKLEQLAEDRRVRAIGPQAEAVTRQ